MRTLKQLTAVSSIVWISFVVCGQDLRTRTDANHQAGKHGTVHGMDSWNVSGENQLVSQSFWIRDGESNGVPQDVAAASRLRTESAEIWPEGGRVRIETTYRGSEKIMSVNIRSNAATRALLLHGNVRYIESDEDGDGHFECVMLPGERAGDFEVFKRGHDGTLTPLPDPELQELKEKAGKASGALLWTLDQGAKEVEPGAAPEPPPAAAVRDTTNNMKPEPESKTPADGGGR